MVTLELSEMVKRISSLVGDQSVKSITHKNNITISTSAWDFNFEYQKEVGCYLYDSVTINDDKLNSSLLDLKKTLMRELVNRYGVLIKV